MANFDEEFNRIIFVEGGYVNDKDDAGGETYLGISRKANPYWKGWEMVDAIKQQNPKSVWNRKMKEHTGITRLAKELYKHKYWDIFKLDEIKSQKVARQIFDTAVNCGATTATKIAQQVIGTKIDGKITQELINKLQEI